MSSNTSEKTNLKGSIEKEDRDRKEKQLIKEKRKQAGIGFPSAGIQKHLLIVRLDIASAAENDKETVKKGLNKLCDLFARLDKGKKKIEILNEEGNLELTALSKYHFSATIGFGIGFFNHLSIPEDKRPKRLKEMPDHTGLGDIAPYSLSQTDLIIQLGSTNDFINRWVLENAVQPVVTSEENDSEATDIVSAIRGWAIIVDVNAGFQRVDGRNLQGFNDGVSNPRRLSKLFDDIVWTTEEDESNPDLVDGTYMVFQKILHDLDQWRSLSVAEQEEWVGRSKGTGLLLGTLSEEEDNKLGEDLRSPDAETRKAALKKWKPLFQAQENPETRFFDHENGDLNGKPKFGEIPLKCPAWSHVRKANPREEDNITNSNGFKIEAHLIFRRGYPFMESDMDNKTRSGLLFVCFQRDITNKFEFIKKNWFNNPDFPVPFFRPFSEAEKDFRHQHGRFSVAELEAIADNVEARKLLGLSCPHAFAAVLKEAEDKLTQCTGLEGLGGPSEHGVITTGQFLATVTLGGGYYFVPPIHNKNIANIGQQFFD
jgi:Dyp-type peroxidase family